MITIEQVANVVSIIGTCCGLFSRVPQVYKTYKTKSAGDLFKSNNGNKYNSKFLFFILHDSS